MVNYKYLNFYVLVFITLTYVSALSCRRVSSNDLLEADDSNIRVASSDTLLVSIFNWARETSDGYVGIDSDPVGPWYEAALPGREAFCIRDVSHQSIGAEILGQGKQNLNMFRKFVENISEEKDYCSYWEIIVNDQAMPAEQFSDARGNIHSYADIKEKAQSQHTAEAHL